MTEQTFIKGKDRDLESSISTMQNKLVALDINVEEALWLNPVANCYSVHIRDKDCGVMFTNGKGATDKACLASALGEYFERLSCNYFFADFYLGEEFANAEFTHYPSEKWFAVDGEQVPEGLMNEQLWDYFDPERELTPSHLYDFNSGNTERGICALPYTRVRDEEIAYIPVNVIGNIFVSNGMSAGNTKYEARVQGLSEVFERAIKNQIIAEGICLPEVPEEVVKQYPKIHQACEELRSHGFHLRIADASLGGKYPVMSVTLINPVDGSVFASFGAHPSFEVALERTVTELLQGRRLDQLDVFQCATFDNDEVASAENIELHFIDSSGLISYDFFRDQADFDFVHWDFSGNTKQEYQFCTDLIHEMGYDIYIMDYTHLNVYACRILVPGLSDIYPVDELIWRNNNEGAKFRQDFLSLDQYDAEQWLEIYDRLEEAGHSDIIRAAEFIGVVTDADTPWHTLRIGELKAHLCLAAQSEEAIDWVEWILHTDQISPERIRFFRCLKAVLEIKYDEQRAYSTYQSSLALMFGADNVELAIEIAEARIQFHGLSFPGLALEGFKKHHALLDGYRKLHRAKAQFWDRQVSDS
ncbi:30S ribosomal protein S12 methylthiotransferase accessory factor YcaO [Pseudoalteromonas ruthenica]|uniref:30S ribosomal protein S12 methylthiotransferase accessory factor YcaO n=1 Tax=Pseudoalteromonas ruthenica TaxID=151081 RepID=UPI00110A66F1|nr:30S ribosomal protein S12 methylthiotransferase accessory factor YcaO [Pseudoalteromonas ruthenica]TMO44323.1 30s ribosomal protein S12 methylthiotransferase accessory protein YcaO [Pseudoalteromonas ruthenica]TMO51520.1 30s ribosomal protein S12 methylthiotransferase accessory protein YcaO [Pseudoalteromonas ruthenica]